MSENDKSITGALGEIAGKLDAIAQAMSGGQGDEEAAKQEVRMKLGELIDALGKRDFDRLDAIWSDDWFFSDATGSISTKHQTMEAIKSGFLVYQPQKYEESTLHVYGNTAVILGRFTIKGNIQGQDISGPYRLIDVFVKKQGRWKVVAEQSTRIMG